MQGEFRFRTKRDISKIFLDAFILFRHSYLSFRSFLVASSLDTIFLVRAAPHPQIEKYSSAYMQICFSDHFSPHVFHGHVITELTLIISATPFDGIPVKTGCLSTVYDDGIYIRLGAEQTLQLEK